jgi:hypothetical protein
MSVLLPEISYFDELELTFLALATPGPRTLDRLRAAGIQNDVLGEPLIGPRFARIQRLDAGRFDLVESEGDPALIVPAIEHGAVVDLLAFDPRQPSEVATLDRRAVALGMDFVSSPWRAGGHSAPIPVVTDMLSWLRAGGHAVFVVDHAAFQQRVQRLTDCLPLVAEDVDHGQALRDLLRPPTWTPPAILVRNIVMEVGA